MTDSEMDRIRQRLQDRLAEISEDLHRAEKKNADRLEKWQLARPADDEAEPAQAGIASPFYEPEAAAEADEETRIETKRRTSALIEQLELVRPEGMTDRGVRFRGR